MFTFLTIPESNSGYTSRDTDGDILDYSVVPDH